MRPCAHSSCTDAEGNPLIPSSRVSLRVPSPACELASLAKRSTKHRERGWTFAAASMMSFTLHTSLDFFPSHE